MAKVLLSALTVAFLLVCTANVVAQGKMKDVRVERAPMCVPPY